MRKFGLIGYPLEHSFSPSYFSEKFKKNNIDATYHLFPLKNIEEFPQLLNENPELEGLNVTIPYKETVLTYLDEVSESAKEIKAVNTIKISRSHSKTTLKGFNTDIFGLKQSLLQFIKSNDIKALILGAGGAAKAVAWVLKNEGITYSLVSRNKNRGNLTYDDLTGKIIENHKLIINTTPLGMKPNIHQYPPLPYQDLTPGHYCLDLIYNPAKTVFLRKAEQMGASIKNGHEMLVLQAEKSWEIWND